MYEYAFRIQNNLEQSAINRGELSGAASGGLLQFNLQLTQDQFQAFRVAAQRFAPADKEVTSRIRALAAADRANHPNTRRLSEETQFQIDTLLSEKLSAATGQEALLRRSLNATDAAQLDAKIVLLYSEQLRKLSLQSGLTGGVASSAGEPSDIRAAIQSVAGVLQPLSTDPGGSNCLYLPANEEQDDEDTCEDEGGVYDRENCECQPPATGGGGGGSSSPTPTITGIAPTPLVIGTNGPMGLGGVNFPTTASGAAVVLSGSGVTVSNVSVTDASNISAEYAVASTAKAGTQTLIVQFSGADGVTAQTNSIPVTITATAPVPAKAVITDMPETTYSNTTYTSCDGSTTQPNSFGYQYCLIYQIEDSSGEAISENFTVVETVSQVASNVSPRISTGNNVSNPGGQFSDQLSLIVSAALPTNACSVQKQTITVSGASSPIRVNCLKFTQAGVTITDVTANPGLCSTTNYSC